MIKRKEEEEEEEEEAEEEEEEEEEDWKKGNPVWVILAFYVLISTVAKFNVYQ